MAAIHHFKDIQAWQAAREIVGMVYRLTADGQIQRDFAFRDQWRRAALSVMNNLAEGFARGSDAQFLHFLDIARGSLAEVESMLFVAEDLSLVSSVDGTPLRKRLDHCAALISKLTMYLRSSMVREEGVAYQAAQTSGQPDNRTSGLWQ